MTGVVMLATKTELNQYIAELALRASQSESKLRQLRWSWLLQPSSTSIASLIAHLRSEKIAPTETALEFENTIFWISLFDPIFAHRKFPNTRFPLFEKIEKPETRFENLLIRYFIADRNGNEKSRNSLYQNLNDSFFSNPAEGSFKGVDALLESIDQLKPPHKKILSSEIVVNLGHWEIEAHRKRFISRPLCLFIELLRNNISISFDDLLAAAFDIPKYDESYHYQKIQNLISRLRALSSHFVIHTRQGRIYSSIDWKLVSIQSMSAHQESLKTSGILDLFLDTEEKKQAIARCVMRISISKLKVTLVSDFSRSEFERVTGFPRSTASRFLKNWLNQDILSRSGSGKATIYNFK
jgi:hypothetical protein